jgi:hypothetical protein
MAVTEKISKLVQNQFPDFYKEDGPNFLAFMEAYYAWMEENDNLTDGIRNLESYRDISTTTDDYIQYFYNTFLPGVPLEIAADKKLLAKYIRQENLSRGTLRAYRLLFRALYNEDVELSYPADQILKVSDGDWRIDRYLVADYDDNTYKFIGKTIKGADSQAEALVEDVIARVIRGRHLMQILVSNVKGTFNHLEPIRLKSDTNATGHTTTIDAGINRVEILTPGGEYRAGDIVEIQSDVIGDFAKVVVTDTIDLGGVLTFSIVSGGSGYTPTSYEGGSVVSLIGGDGTEPASFQILSPDISDTYAISTCTTLIQGNTAYGALAPIVTFADGIDRQMNYFANTLLSSPTFGFPEDGEVVTKMRFSDHESAKITISNTADIGVGNSIFALYANGTPTGANGTVLSIVDSTAGAAVLEIDGYKNFNNSEIIHMYFANTSGSNVGTVSAFAGNTISKQVVAVGYIGNTALTNLQVGDELVGLTSDCYGVVRKVISTVANGYSRGVGGADDRDLVTVIVSANTTANLTSQFDTGPIKGAFIENEGLRLVGSSTPVGNVATSGTTANVVYENVYTNLEDSIIFTATTFGTIAKLSLIDGGSGYSIAPRVSVEEQDIKSLGIGEAWLTLESDDVHWNTGNSSITALDTNDRIVQANTGCSGDIKGGDGTAVVSTTVLANGTYQTVVRVWQDFLQREPAGRNWANNQHVDIKIYDSSYVPGEDDTRSPVGTGSALITSIRDGGVLGKNANITASVGANGTIFGLRVVDSGFSYGQFEEALLEATDRPLAQSARVKVTLGGVSNAEGYYATERSHISTTRGYIQDSRFYQEFSYQIISAISLSRYRELALELVHPAGNALFGKYRSSSNAALDIAVDTYNARKALSNGTIAINDGSFDLVGTGTSFTSEFANNDTIIIEYAHKQFYSIPLNIVSSATSANVKIAWANTNLSGANAYYSTGTF